jgi:hypothetical protein
MAISIKHYVNIVSRVGGAAIAPRRELIGRLFTTNPLIPVMTLVEMTSAREVLEYFGAGAEYERAKYYFSFVSKQTTMPRKLSFWRWPVNPASPASDIPATIFGGKASTLAALQTISTGSMIFKVDGTPFTLSGIDFSGAANMAAVAAIIQAALNAQSDPHLIASTVTYNATTGGFDFLGDAFGNYTIEVTNSLAGQQIMAMIGWKESIASVNPRFSNGTYPQPAAETLDESQSLNDNFGSFAFVDNLTDEENVWVAEQNDLYNVKFMFCLRIRPSPTLYEGLLPISGTSMTWEGEEVDWPKKPESFTHLLPMAILASTDYSRPAASQNYMFQQHQLSVSIVTDDIIASDLDASRINYYGETQTAGKKIAFFQRGKLTGLDTAPIDMNVYANEIWLKDAAQSEIMNLLLGLGRIPANDQGKATILSGVQTVVDEALFNGVISVGKPLTNVQKAYITDISGNALAWRQVQNIGYFMKCALVPYENAGSTEWKAVYTLIYSKDDAIRAVDGSHVLI